MKAPCNLNFKRFPFSLLNTLYDFALSLKRTLNLFSHRTAIIVVIGISKVKFLVDYTTGALKSKETKFSHFSVLNFNFNRKLV